MTPTKEKAPKLSGKECSYRKVLEIVSSKWAVLIIVALGEGSKQYGQLRRRIDGISQKMLTQTLRQLERDGLVKRCIHPSVPPTVEYSLSPVGKTLIPHMIQMKAWVNEYYSQIEDARRLYDLNNGKEETDPCTERTRQSF